MAMFRSFMHILTSCSALLVINLSFLSPAAEEKPEPKPVSKVLKVDVERNGGALLIKAVGQVPTGGYTAPTLMRVTYVKQPDDGIQDYQFTATPPAGPATQVLSKVVATDKWDGAGEWVKGVRVHGADGSAVAILPQVVDK
jgi:hypothetical protein